MEFMTNYQMPKLFKLFGKQLNKKRNIKLFMNFAD